MDKTIRIKESSNPSLKIISDVWVKVNQIQKKPGLIIN